MPVLDEDFGTDLTPVEGNGGVRSCPVSVPERTPRDLRSLYERECARADRDPQLPAGRRTPLSDVDDKTAAESRQEPEQVPSLQTCPTHLRPVN